MLYTRPWIFKCSARSGSLTVSQGGCGVWGLAGARALWEVDPQASGGEKGVLARAECRGGLGGGLGEAPLQS